jgi:hypothetical protein
VAWKTGNLEVDDPNPPLADYWLTLPYTLLRFHAFPSPDLLAQNKYHYSFSFIHHNPYSLSWMLQAPRMMNVLFALILGAVLFAWAEAALGRKAALGAIVTYAFCPVLLAYGHIATVDMGGTLGWVLAYVFAWRWVQAPGFRNAGMAGLAVGLALCMKYSTLLVLPALTGTLCFEWDRIRHNPFVDRRHAVYSFLLAFLVANMVMAISYRGWGLPEWRAGIFRLTPYFKEGHLNYFWGRYSHTGWFLYFITAFLLKTPIPFLGVGISGLFLWKRMDPHSRAFLLSGCLWPVGLIFVVSSFSSIQVGIRHILPVYPFLCLWVGAVLATLWDTARKSIQKVVIFLGIWYIAGTVFAFPRYLSYFNESIGPSANGYRYLVDSNLDWGQGLKSLGDDLAKRGSPTIYLSYFGCADPALYGIHYQPVLMATCSPLDGQGDTLSQNPPQYLAVSATNRVGLYFEPHDALAWLDARRPIQIDSDSIWLYDISQDFDAQKRLLALQASSR